MEKRIHQAIQIINKTRQISKHMFWQIQQSYGFLPKNSKIISHNLSRFVDKLTDSEIHCSPSLVLCKPLHRPNKNAIKEQPIRAYTFYKPKSFDGFVAGLGTKLAEQKQEINSVYSESFWNNSSYPLVEITYGNNYNSVINHVRETRKKMHWAIDSSTIITLGINLEEEKIMKDRACKSIPSVVFFKNANFSEIDKIKIRPKNVKIQEWSNPMERFGWFDIADSMVFNSLYDLYKFIRETKDREKDRITSAATLLLREIKK